MKNVFLSILLAFNLCNSYAQSYYDSLKVEYSKLQSIDGGNITLNIAKAMNRWAYETEGDTSLRLAESYRYIGNSFLNYDSSLFYYILSKNMLEKQGRSNHPASAYVLFNLGLAYSNYGEHVLAELNFSQSLNIFISNIGIETSICASILNSLGFLNLKMGEYNKAETCFLKSIEIRKIIVGEKHQDYINTLNNLGILYLIKRDYKSAEYVFTKVSISNKVLNGEKHPSYALSLNKLGILYMNTFNWRKSEDCLFKSLNIIKYNYGEDNLEYASTLNDIGDLYRNLGKYKVSIKYYNKAYNIVINKNGKNNMNCFTSLNGVAISYQELGDFPQALFCYEEALTILENIKSKNNADLASVLSNLAEMHESLGDYNKAKLYFDSALSIKYLELGKTHPDYILGLSGLANLYLNIGNYKKADSFYKIILNYHQSTDTTKNIDYAHALHNMGLLKIAIGDFNSAKLYCLKSIYIYSNGTQFKQLDYAEISNTLALIYRHLKDFKISEKYQNQAVKIISYNFGKNHPKYISFIINRGNLYLYLNKYKRAKKDYYHALKRNNIKSGISHNKYALIYNNIGGYYYSINDYNNALKYFKKGMDIKNIELTAEHPSYNVSLNNLIASLIAMKNYRLATFYLDSSLTLNSKHLSKNFMWMSSMEKEVYWNKEGYFYKNLNYFSSIAYFEVPLISSLSFNSTILSKSLLLLTSQELEMAIIESESDTFLQKQFIAMKQYRLIYNKFISESSDNTNLINLYKNKADSLDKILVNKVGEYAAAKRKFEITWKDVQDSLQYNHAAIEFARYYDDKDTIYKYMALVVRPDYTYPKLVPLASESAIKKAVKSKNFPALYNLVWKDIDTLLSGVSTIYYSPAGELNNVAFSALCYSNGQSSSACNTYLLDKYSLHQLTTTRYLADGTLKKSKPLKTEIALFGGINYDVIPKSANSIDTYQSNESYVFEINLEKQKQISGTRNATYSMGMPYLEGTRVEVGTIGSLMNKNKWKVETRTDTVASEHNLKKLLQEQSPGVLHIATHGFAFAEEVKKEKREIMMGNESNYRISEDPMVRCGLMMGGSNVSWTGQIQKMVHETGEDGILTAAEVANMDLRGTKLAVLSACETGLGQIESTEGTFGLKRGFKLAGVEQIIVSLWSVPDKETMEMMNQFYSDLAITSDPVISFEKSQKAMRERYPTQPTKWAGFVLIR